MRNLVLASVKLDVAWSDDPQKFGEEMKLTTHELVSYYLNGYGQELDALKLCEWLLKGQVKCLGEDHQDVFTTLNNTGMAVSYTHLTLPTILLV